MTWFKNDDSLHAHRKTRRAGLEAMGLWVVAGTWSANQLTDGFVPQWFVEGWPKGKALAARLVRAGFWTCAVDDGEAGWRFHDWLDYNPSAEQERARKKGAADRQKRARDRAVGQHVTRYVTGDVTRDVLVPRPGPSRPDPSGTERGGGAEPNGRARPPLYPNRCAEHGDVAEPGPCGACADARKAPRLTVVPLATSRSCLVHAQPDVRVCSGCAADAKAAPGS